MPLERNIVTGKQVDFCKIFDVKTVVPLKVQIFF